MGTKTEDEAGTKTGTEAQRDEEAGAAETADDQADSEVLGEDEIDDEAVVAAERGSGVGLGAAAVVSAGLGVVSLTGSWVGTIAQARDSLYGQLETAQSAGVAEQIKQVYADSWNANALVAGFFALTALIVGVVVLVRPAFGNPDRIPAQAPWVKSVAWAGVALGVVGLLLAALKYSDILLGMPSTS
ncbi:hypothetical protein OOK29_24530 [Streptomyces phaeochromogenes]|uniref:hypothetical protein n=1 Tax=Streptomyces phaeochromogenes TaxID=1923 RepID=UPI00224FD74F|nr:hypothetical protein [Streptomyces phaeochromogenes]MCX5601317.1 hypothetical protein [Streptomyces phaeochromogenes]